MKFIIFMLFLIACQAKEYPHTNSYYLVKDKTIFIEYPDGSQTNFTGTFYNFPDKIKTVSSTITVTALSDTLINPNSAFYEYEAFIDSMVIDGAKRYVYDTGERKTEKIERIYPKATMKRYWIE